MLRTISLWEAADERTMIFSHNWITGLPPRLATTEGLSSNNNRNTTTAATAGPELTERDEDEGSTTGLHALCHTNTRDFKRCRPRAGELPRLLPESWHCVSKLILSHKIRIGRTISWLLLQNSFFSWRKQTKFSGSQSRQIKIFKYIPIMN